MRDELEVLGARVTLVERKWCCRFFESCAPKNGADGLRMMLVPTSDATECYLEFRSRTDTSGEFETGTRIKFCPWCGRSVAKVYGRRKSTLAGGDSGPR